jgi:hypothetical protein
LPSSYSVKSAFYFGEYFKINFFSDLFVHISYAMTLFIDRQGYGTTRLVFVKSGTEVSTCMVLKHGSMTSTPNKAVTAPFCLLQSVFISGYSELSAVPSYEGAEGAADPSLIFFSRTISQTADIFQKTLRKQNTSSLYRKE